MALGQKESSMMFSIGLMIGVIIGVLLTAVVCKRDFDKLEVEILNLPIEYQKRSIERKRMLGRS